MQYPTTNWFEKFFDERIAHLDEGIGHIDAQLRQLRKDVTLNTAFRHQAIGVWIGLGTILGAIVSMIGFSVRG